MEVSRSGFYDWLDSSRKKAAEAVEHSCVVVDMKQIFESSHGSYGSRRISAALQALGHDIGGTELAV